jgi:hypothetical protein
MWPQEDEKKILDHHPAQNETALGVNKPPYKYYIQENGRKL